MRCVYAITSAVAIWTLILAACGSDSEQNPSPTRSQAATRPRSTSVTVAPTDVNACDRAVGLDERFSVVAHDEGAQDRVAEIEAAITRAIEQVAPRYDWYPLGTICLHAFSTKSGYVEGLQTILGHNRGYAESVSRTGGTVGFDVDKGRDVILLNTSANIDYIVTHEYAHIVTGQQEYGGAPIWFLEGISELEASRAVDNHDFEWLASLVALEKAGQAPRLAQLVDARDWVALDDPTSAYAKALLALMYFEQIAGQEAITSILVNMDVDDLTNFYVVFRLKTGLGIGEFEKQLLPFAEELLAEQ